MITLFGSEQVVRVGTSGFSYREWLGGFYPAKLPATQMLSHYAQHLLTVEINYTFRAMPRVTMLEGWARQTPTLFRFALKAPQRITHWARLRGAEEALETFIERSAALGERLGPVLFQLPPDMTRDNELLYAFLARLRGRLRPAFEFRHPSWFEDSVFQTLREGAAALCIAESDKLSTPAVQTASFLYVRLRKSNYGPQELAAWAERLNETAREAREIYIFFKHEQAAPELASRMTTLMSSGTG
jgi:uncharacterized protein YecE (DUF72 family)